MAPCGGARVSEEQSGEATGEGASQLQWRPQHFGDASTTGLQTKTTAAVEWSQVSLARLCVLGQALWSLEDGEFQSLTLSFTYLT